MRDSSGKPPDVSGDGRTQAGPPDSGDITRLLGEVTRGSRGAEASLFESVYEELQALAHARLRSESRNVTLSTTGLVHEAYLKLVPVGSIDWQDRSHFFATAARAMRRVLIDRARAARRLKRGGGEQQPVVTEGLPTVGLGATVAKSAEELLALDEALERLGAMSHRQLRVVELRFFAGLSIPETADVLGVAQNTVKRDWATARAWLNRELSP